MMDFLFSMHWWEHYFLSIISISVSNFKSVHKSFKTLRILGSIGLLVFITLVLLTHINWGIFSAFILLFYISFTVILKQKYLYPGLRKQIPKPFEPLYDQLFTGKSIIDDESVNKSIEEDLKKKVSEYLDSS